MGSANFSYRTGVALALAAACLLGWMNLAVGIAGNEENPVNLSFFVLIGAAAIGAYAVEFRAKGMARTMLGVAALQILLGVIVSTGPVAAYEPAGPTGLAALNGFFALLWLVSGALFAKAMRAS